MASLPPGAFGNTLKLDPELKKLSSASVPFEKVDGSYIFSPKIILL